MVCTFILYKVVSCSDEVLQIPPRGSAELKIEYVPRKINSDYSKTITLINRFNDRSREEVEIRACNMDTHHVLYHSAFYKVSVSNKLKQLQVFFSRAIVNSPTLRAFCIENIYEMDLEFALTTSSPEVKVFAAATELAKLGANAGMRVGIVPLKEPSSPQIPVTSLLLREAFVCFRVCLSFVFFFCLDGNADVWGKD